MKWVTLISCLFLISSAESKQLPRRYRDVGHHDTFRHFIKIAEGQFPGIIIGLLSQNLQRASYDEVAKLNDNLVQLAKKCSSDDQATPDCEKPLRTVFLDEICHEEGLAEKYVFTECCGKVDPERNDCFLTHKNETSGFIPPFVMPDGENVCKVYQDTRAEFLANYYYELSRRHPFANVAVLYKTVKEFEKVLQTCCLETDKDACFREKLPAVREQKNYAIGLQKHTCSILKEFGKRSLRFQEVADLSRKFPKADFPIILKFAGDIVHIQEEFCKGDTLEYVLDVADLIEYICTHQDTISTKVKDCCDRELLDREECLVNAENDDKPADLPSTFKEFVVKEVCQNFTENKATLLEKFVYETGRRNPEFSKQLLLRVGSKYEGLLGKCCETEHPEECFHQGEGELRQHADNTLETFKMRCNLYEKAGDHGFQNEVLVHYTKRAPEMAFEELYQYTMKFAGVIAKCCKEDDAHIVVCADENTDLLLGEVCQRHEVKPLNKQMHNCCEDSYEFRRDCFSSLGVDPDYVPVPFSSELFTSHQDLCSATPDELLLRKQKQLVHIIKHQPNSTTEQIAEVTGYFTTMVTQCCEAENHEECFMTEGPKLVECSRAVFGEQ
ncbi:serum albumin-like [Podarcis lilfordi]|uniref:Serum albumin-like n=1 Tax=Podarcis lilfordi TaxID=74358 RepID=A0AA35PMT7_9SAUR|nr:serum albumin-like [Podarcis lilfordi]